MENRPVRALLVEDDEDDFILVRRLLSQAPSTRYDVQWARTYEEGLRLAEEDHYSVYLVDYRLGERDGLELLRALDERGSAVPVILLTGQGDYQLDIVAMRAGASDYLDKSHLNPSQLERSIRYAIERKRSEQERLRLSAVVEQTTEGAIITSLDGNITYINPAFETMSGYVCEEVLRKHLSVLMNDEQESASVSDIREQIISGSTWRGRLTNRRKDGSVYDVEAVVSAVKDKRGIITSYVALERDITEQLALERRLNQSQKIEAMGTLAGGIAHDFNNIIAAIIGFTELAIEDTPENRSVQQSLERVLKAAMRGKDLVKRILTFSRKSEEERRPEKLSALVREALGLLRASLPSSIHIDFEVLMSSDTILANQTQIQQVVMNLCTNAAYAMREKGGIIRIVVSGADAAAGQTLPGEDILLSVSDTGDGMAKDVMERIFDPFYTTKGPGEGTGLGLSVTLGIIESHGGTITAESEPGRGTTFSVLLPRLMEDVLPNTDQEEISLRGNERILFVDDEPMLGEMGERILTRLGYQVLSIVDPTEAMRHFAEDPNAFDLVITDQTMPRITGIELAQKMTSLRDDIPIILCTGFSHSVNGETARAAGIRAFILKPLTREEMGRVIRNVLDQRTNT